MDYLRIFDEVVDIMHNDYSGCVDKRGCDRPAFFRDKIKGLGATGKRKFLEIVEEYLLAFRDYHVSFEIKGLKRKSLGFSVRRFEDALYVVESLNPDFKKGDKIIGLGRDGIAATREKYKDFFFESTAEREDWGKVLLKYKSCTLEDKNGFNGFVRRELRKVASSGFAEKYKYSARQIDDKTLYLKLPHFCDEDETKRLVSDNFAALESCTNLIIDVRINIGGSDINFFPLLKYILPDRAGLGSLFPQMGGMTVNYSKRNCEGRISLLSQWLIGADELTQKHLFAVISDLEQKSGQGFLPYPDDDIESFDIVGQPSPQNVVVLSDFDCGSSGDAFVQLCKLSKKVTVMGRPTMGITDYSNLNSVKLDTAALHYPTSRDDAIDSGKGLGGKGVAVDFYIPWTPAHLEKDIDLEFALSHLGCSLATK